MLVIVPTSSRAAPGPWPATTVPRVRVPRPAPRPPDHDGGGAGAPESLPVDGEVVLDLLRREGARGLAGPR